MQQEWPELRLPGLATKHHQTVLTGPRLLLHTIFFLSLMHKSGLLKEQSSIKDETSRFVRYRPQIVSPDVAGPRLEWMHSLNCKDC